MTDSPLDTVLLVDDDRVNRMLLADTLQLDCHVLLAKDGPSALRQIRENSEISLVLLDVSMPGMDGYEVLRLLKADGSTAHVPVVFITGNTDEAEEERGLAAGAVDYIVKPVRPALVRARIRTLLKTAILERELTRPPASAPPGSPDPAVVLLVDDEAVVAEAVRADLQGLPGLEFHHCADGTGAVHEAVRLRPTVILQDLSMPGVDGLLLLARYREHPCLRDVPVLVLSGQEEPLVKAQAFEIGASDYLVKPTAQAELLARIRFHSQAYQDRLRRDEAARVLREAMRLREDFSHFAVHDLGSPLATILLDADELLAAASSGVPSPALLRIRDNALRLSSMTQDMLLLAKMEEGKLRIDSRPGDLLATVKEAVRNLAPFAERRGLEIRVEASSSSLEARYDAALLLRVMDNLLSNALKFSPASGVVVVRAVALEGGVQVEIEDRGPGIPEEVRERIFDKFEVGALRKDVPQSGLGLTFCRMAVEAHGGRIGVEAGTEGGSVFRFRF